MLTHTLSLFIVTILGPGEIKAPDVPASSEVFVSSKVCNVRHADGKITGTPGCPIKVAIIDEEGQVTRHDIQLPEDTDDVENTEDRPIDAEDDNDEDAPTRSKSVLTKADNNETLAPFFGLGFGRDISAFGLADLSLNAGVQYGKHLRMQLAWRRGLARTRTELLTIERKVELTSDMFLGKIGYLRPIKTNLSAYVDIGVGVGRFVSDDIADDRNQLSASTQAFVLYRPSLGFEWATGRVRLSVGWQLTFAEGDWFDADSFGTSDSDIPPENSGLMAQGLELNLGIQL